MKIGLYNPYIGVVTGGGERYTTTIASHLSKRPDTIVDVIFPKNFPSSKLDERKKELSQKFAIDLKEVHFRKGPFGEGTNFLDRLWFTKKFDVIYFLTDGSFFLSLAKKNIVYFQVPLPLPSFSNRLKLRTWNKIVCNSNFTKNWLEKQWRKKVDYLLGGSVNVDLIAPKKKENLILNVGRFFLGLHTKRQDILVDAFIDLCKGGLTGWKFILVGTIDPGGGNRRYYESLLKKSKGYPIEIKTAISFSGLNELYAKSKIYWHATGYGVDQSAHPEMTEHFGITIFESMAGGAVPVVIKKGGIVEIVEEGKSGFLWGSVQELEGFTKKLIDDELLFTQMSREARKRSLFFSDERFFKILDEIIYEEKRK